MKKILLTGSNGYIAQSIYNKLCDKYDFVLLNRDVCDLTSTKQVDQFFIDSKSHFDCIIHTAITGGSRLKVDDQDVITNNILMFYNLYKNEHHYKQFISLGSGAELYDNTSPYGFSKYIINNIINSKQNFFNLRIFGIFDENELDTRFIKRSIYKSLEGKPIEIYQDKKMDFFYMKDFISLLEYYLNNAKNCPKNIDCCYKENYYLSDIAKTITSLCDTDIIITDNDIGNSYTGSHTEIDIKYDGLLKGIHDTFYKLKDRYECSN